MTAKPHPSSTPNQSSSSSPRLPDQPANLPRSFTSFIGREREIDLVSELVRRDDVRLVTLTGPGGVGKTRLSTQVAERLRTAVDHIWFVSLASAGNPEVASSAITRELEGDPAVAPPTDPFVRNALVDAQSLLVLDNFEHVLGASNQVSTLLTTYPLLTILVTSRIPLNLSAEHAFPVEPLAVPASDAIDVTRDDALPESIQLFIDRARSHVATFELTPTNASAISRICRSLDGIPLAIELAAARVAMMSPSVIASRLDRQLTLLTSGPRDAPARQRTIRDSIAWSYELLESPPRVLFRRLGVFAGGFTLEAAEAVTGNDSLDLLNDVASLVASNLIHPVDWAVPTEPRYRMLDSVREFALEQARQDPGYSDLRHAHARYYTALAEDALPLYDGPDLLPTMVRVCAELANARAAINWSLQDGNREHGVRLAGALWRLWHSSLTGQEYVWLDRVAQGRMIVDQALPYIDELPVEAVTELLAGAANLSTVLGNTDAALEHSRELWRRSSTAGYNYGKYWALCSEGQAAYNRKDFTRAITLWEECALLAPTIRNPENHTVLMLLSLSVANSFTGRLHESSALLARGLELARVCGNPTMIGWATILAGQEARARGALKDAFALLRESAYHGMVMQNDSLTAALVSIARIALALDSTDCAIELLGYSTWSPFPDDQRDLKAAFAEVGDVAGKEGLERIAVERRSLDPSRLEHLLANLEKLLESTPVTPIPHGPLSPREREVILLLADGRTNRAIADRLSISDRTVENHVAHILTKLNLDSRAAAAAWAVRHDLC